MAEAQAATAPEEQKSHLQNEASAQSVAPPPATESPVPLEEGHASLATVQAYSSSWFTGHNNVGQNKWGSAAGTEKVRLYECPVTRVGHAFNQPKVAPIPQHTFVSRRRTTSEKLLNSSLVHPSHKLVTSREFCIRLARDKSKTRSHVATGRALLRSFRHSPADAASSADFTRSMRDIAAQRPFFRAPPWGNKGGMMSRLEEEPEEEVEEEVEEISSEEEDEDMDAARKADWREFNKCWKRIKPEVAAMMKKEDEEGWKDLRLSIWDYYSQLRAVFRHYCALDQEEQVDDSAPMPGKDPNSSAFTVSQMEFHQFMSDIERVSQWGTEEPKTLSKQITDIIFVRANWERDETGKFIQDETNPDHEMLLYEFLHSLIRVAAEVYQKDCKRHADRTRKFIKEDVLPKASKVNIEGFRKKMKSKSLKKVFLHHQFRLDTLYKFYAGLDSVGNRNTMSLQEFSQFCIDAKLFSEFFTEDKAVQVFIASQASAAAEEEEEDDEDIPEGEEGKLQRTSSKSKKAELAKMLTARRGSKAQTMAMDNLLGKFKGGLAGMGKPKSEENSDAEAQEAEPAPAAMDAIAEDAEEEPSEPSGEGGAAAEEEAVPEEGTLAEVAEEEQRKKEVELMDRVRGHEIEHVSGEDGAADDDDSELVYGEFKECIARIADIWNPDQYLALHIKVEQLIEEQIMQIPLQQMGALEDDGEHDDPFE